MGHYATTRYDKSHCIKHGRQLWFSKVTKTIEIPAMNKPLNLSQRLQEGHQDACWATEVHYMMDHGLIIMEAIRQGYAITVTDGPFKSDASTSAYVIGGQDKIG